MLVGQYVFAEAGWTLVGGLEAPRPDLVLIFGSAEPARMRGAIAAMRTGFPMAHIAGCTSSGEMLAGKLLDGSIVAAALQLENAQVHTHGTSNASRRDSFAAGRRLGQAIVAPDLKGVLVLAEGIDCDGSLLLSGLCDIIGDETPVFGGLAADGLDFVVTRVAANGPFESGQAVAVGFYGTGLTVTYGAGAGWQPQQRIGEITNSAGSIIYEIDGRPALVALREAGNLSSPISFHDLMTMPLWITHPVRNGAGMIRTAVGADENRGSLIMAGDLPRHGVCSIMGATLDDIAAGAAWAASQALGGAEPGLVLSVSCVGRKALLGASAHVEVEAVKQAIGSLPQIGFYSYGEFGAKTGESCRFLNQTMCVTIIGERPA
jgi:hypothetical protein